MRVRKSLLLLIVCVLMALSACAKSATPTATPEHKVAVPDLRSEDVKPTSAVETPALPGQPTRTPYPAPGTPSPQEAKSPYPAPLSGEKLLEARCQGCHDLARTKTAKKDADGWRRTVERMVSKGAQLTAEESEVLIKYLAETYK